MVVQRRKFGEGISILFTTDSDYSCNGRTLTIAELLQEIYVSLTIFYSS